MSFSLISARPPTCLPSSDSNRAIAADRIRKHRLAEVGLEDPGLENRAGEAHIGFMQKTLGPNATKLMSYFRERSLIAGDFVIAGEIGPLIPNVGDRIAAINELVRAGWLIVDPKSAGPVPNVALTDFGHQMIYQPGGK